MKKSAFATVAIASIAGSAFAGTVGPDVIVGGLPNVANWGSVGGVSAYSVATTSCNIGDQQLNWNPSTNVHPVIGQAISRVSPVGDNGTKIDMLGSSWLKHGFCALQQNLCGACQPAGGGCPPVLGIGCSDPYSAGLNGSQGGLGLPAEVNPHTGFYPTNWTGRNQSGGTLFKRIQVQNTDLMTAGATYFISGQYVQPEDSSFGNQDNNMSYRQAAVSGTNIFGQGQTFREEPVINAWKQVDNSVTLLNVNIPENELAGDMDGLVVLGYDVSENNDGTWHYEYALNNISSDNRVRGFAIPGLDPADVTNFEFSAPAYHSGSPISNTPWDTSDSTSDRFVVGGEAFSDNANANSLFWGRLYRVGFDSPNPPEVINAEIITFKTNEIVQTRVAAPQSATLCLGDCNEDGVVDFGDLTATLFAFGDASGAAPGCDANGDGQINFGDLTATLFAFGPCE